MLQYLSNRDDGHTRPAAARQSKKNAKMRTGTKPVVKSEAQVGVSASDQF